MRPFDECVREVLAVRLCQGGHWNVCMHPWGSSVCPFATISTSAQLLFVHVINFAWRRKGRELSMSSLGWMWIDGGLGRMGGKTLPKATPTTGVCCQTWQMLTNASKIIFEQTKTRRQRKLILFAFISAGNLRRLQHWQLSPAPRSFYQLIVCVLPLYFSAQPYTIPYIASIYRRYPSHRVVSLVLSCRVASSCQINHHPLALLASLRFWALAFPILLRSFLFLFASFRIFASLLLLT